jgi:hypothetical protein
MSAHSPVEHALSALAVSARCLRSLSAFSRLGGFAQAARPLAGGSPSAVLDQDQDQIQHFWPALRQTRQMDQPPEFLEPFSPQARKPRVRPNPSIERTSTGLARFTSLVHVPLRGPIRFRPAHVKR